MTKKIIHIFKNDLRLSDNPAFAEASKSGHIIPIYIVDESDLNHDSAQNWWLQKSLEKLKKSLDDNLYFLGVIIKKLLLQLFQKMMFKLFIGIDHMIHIQFKEIKT